MILLFWIKVIIHNFSAQNIQIISNDETENMIK